MYMSWIRMFCTLACVCMHICMCMHVVCVFSSPGQVWWWRHLQGGCAAGCCPAGPQTPVRTGNVV
jgi:hypothetical protein